MRFHTCIWVGGGGQDIGLKFFGTGGQVMGHTDAFIQHHRVVQLLITIPRLAKPPFVKLAIVLPGKQPANAEHLSVACFEHEI